MLDYIVNQCFMDKGLLATYKYIGHDESVIFFFYLKILSNSKESPMATSPNSDIFVEYVAWHELHQIRGYMTIMTQSSCVWLLTHEVWLYLREQYGRWALTSKALLSHWTKSIELFYSPKCRSSSCFHLSGEREREKEDVIKFEMSSSLGCESRISRILRQRYNHYIIICLCRLTIIQLKWLLCVSVVLRKKFLYPDIFSNSEYLLHIPIHFDANDHDNGPWLKVGSIQLIMSLRSQRYTLHQE